MKNLILITITFLFSQMALSSTEIENKIGKSISYNKLEFTNESGTKQNLSEYFKKDRPIILAPVYYGCPGTCTVVISTLLQNLKTTGFSPGKAFDVVFVSINPKEPPEMAKEKKNNYMKLYGFENSSNYFHFLVGEQKMIDRITDELGFNYEKVGDQFVHAGIVYFLSENGKIIRTMSGTKTTKRHFTSLLLDAKNEQSNGFFSRMTKFCGRYVKRYNYSTIIGTTISSLLILFIIFLRKRRNV